MTWMQGGYCRYCRAPRIETTLRREKQHYIYLREDFVGLHRRMRAAVGIASGSVSTLSYIVPALKTNLGASRSSSATSVRGLRRRSPMLAVFSGVTGVLVSGPSIFDQTLEYDTIKGAEMFLYVPLMLCFTAMYVTRGLRLLVLYNPHSRQRWGSLLREKPLLTVLLGIFAVLEGVVWSFVPVYGVAR